MSPPATLHAAGRADRLARAFLVAVAVGGILLLTLTPGRERPGVPHPGVSLVAPSHVGEKTLNVLLFVPLGVALVLAGRRRAIAWGAALSVAIEATQLGIPGRLTSLADVALNTAGAALGVWLIGGERGRRSGARLVRLTRSLLAPSRGYASLLALVATATVLSIWLGTAECSREAGGSTCAEGFGLDTGWAVLLNPGSIPPRLGALLSAVWMGVLCSVPAFWAPSARSAMLAIVLLGAGLRAVSWATGLPDPRTLSLLGALGGLVLGHALGRLVRAYEVSTT